MDFKQLKQALNEMLTSAESAYGYYVNKLNDLNEFSKRVEMKQMEVQQNEQVVGELLEKYKEVESLESVQNNAELTIKAAEGKMNELAGERAKFEKYRSEEIAKIDRAKQTLYDSEKALSQKEKNLRDEIDDFNKTKKKYILMEGEASW